MMKRKWIFLFSLLLLANVSSPGLRASYSYYEEEDTSENEQYTEAEDQGFLNENVNSTDVIAERIKDEKLKLLELSENISVAIPLESETELETMNLKREPAVIDQEENLDQQQKDEDQSLFTEEETDSVQLGSSAILKTPFQEEAEQSAPTYQKRRNRSR